MSNLPGFSKVGGVTKFSELEIDNSFTENMKQLNQKSKTPNKYQWDLKELTLQSDQQITMDYSVSGMPIHAIGKPYWNLLYGIDQTLPKVQQEFSMNIEEATVGDSPATISIRDQNTLFEARQDQDNIRYSYINNDKETSVLSQGVTLLNYNAFISPRWIHMNEVSYNDNTNSTIDISTNHISCVDIKNSIPLFYLGQSENKILDEKILTEGSGLDGFKALVGEQSFDDVMKTLNGNGTENTYLLNENAKIKIGDNLKVSTEADTPTTGGSE